MVLSPGIKILNFSLALEGLLTPLRLWYSEFSPDLAWITPKFCSREVTSFGSNRKFQQHPQLAEIITPELLVIWRCIYTFWKDMKILYHFYIVRFSWFCTKFSQQGFARSSSVQIRIYIQGSSTCALCSNDHNFFSVYWIWAYEYYWKVEKVKYEFGIGSFLRLYLDWTQKFKILRLLKSDQPRISAVWPTSKLHNS
jgi:hypothetical protein